jgi:hypothetical protein
MVCARLHAFICEIDRHCLRPLASCLPIDLQRLEVVQTLEEMVQAGVTPTIKDYTLAMQVSHTLSAAHRKQ